MTTIRGTACLWIVGIWLATQTAHVNMHSHEYVCYVGTVRNQHDNDLHAYCIVWNGHEYVSLVEALLVCILKVTFIYTPILGRLWGIDIRSGISIGTSIG